MGNGVFYQTISSFLSREPDNESANGYKAFFFFFHTVCLLMKLFDVITMKSVK